MGNLITDRVAYFLKDFPPFDELSEEVRDQIANRITVRYCEKGTLIFEEGNENNDFCYVLNQGNVKLTKADPKGQKQLVDQCEPGEVFGVRSIITGKPYSMSAECHEETLVYAIPKSYFQELFNSNPSFAGWFASGYAAGQAVVRKSGESTEEVISSTVSRPLDYTREVVTCLADDSIQEVAKIMSSNGIGSIVIADQKKQPIGIVTDTDLRNKVLATGKDANTKVSSIMTSPVKTVSSTITYSEVLMEIIRSGVHHLVMTRDGTGLSEICGIISDHDVMISQQNHPASLIKSIKRSNDPGEWAKIRNTTDKLLTEYLEQGLNTELVSGLITKINDTIIEKAIVLVLEKYQEAKKVNFCWLSLGSEGREEQLLRTDQDNAILFEDTDDNSIQSLLLKVAEEVNDILMQCGFEKCPADIMARNPKYCQPLSVWKQYFTDWITKPDPKSVMNATIFFDYRVGYGDSKLADELGNHLVSSVKKNELFLNFLAQNALQNPAPLSFFKNFLVERSGEHKDEFDIKKRAMMPLSDAARLLTLDHYITGIQNTADRFNKLAEIENSNTEVYQAAAESYQIFMAHRAKNGLLKGDSGRFIDLDRLNKLERQMLKNAFESIKELQDIIKVRFQQAYFS